MKIFDTHSHYFDEMFQSLEGGADGAVAKAKSENVCGLLICGTDADNSREAIRLANKYSDEHFFAYAACGIHPECCEEARENITSAIDEIRTIADDEKIIAIGEIGLDYHWDYDKALQH